MSSSNILTCRASSHVSSMMGNVAAVVKEHLQKGFPRGYFKNVAVTTSMPSIDMSSADTFNKQLPLMAIKPDFDVTQDTLFGTLPQWHRAWEHIFRSPRKNYRGVFYNDEDGIYIYSIPDRIAFTFDVQVLLSSYMQKIDLVNYIRQMYDVGGYKYLNEVPLESQIPNFFIQLVMGQKGVNKDDPASMQEFNDYMKQYSAGYVQVKKNQSSGIYLYTYKHRPNILCHIEDLRADDTDRKGQVEDVSRVTFRLVTELWIPANFVLETTKTLEPPPYDPESDTGNTFTLNYTLKTEPPQTVGKLSLIIWSGYTADLDATIDKLNITELFSDQVQKIVKHNNDAGTDNWGIFNIVVYRDGTQLLKDTDFTFDWETLTLSTIFPFYGVTYHVGVYADLPALNEAWSAISGEDL